MSLILFVIGFIIVSAIILWLSNFILGNNNVIITDDLNSGYITTFVKGSSRGSMGLLESNSMLEAKRTQLNKKNSKF